MEKYNIEEFDLENIDLAKFKKSKGLCHHFHKVYMSEEEGEKNDLPFENWRFATTSYTFHSEDEYWYEFWESTLHKKTDTTCVCSVCSREFPIEYMDKADKVLEWMKNLGIDEDVYLCDPEILTLCQELEPTWYQADMSGNITILGIEKNPRKWMLAPNRRWKCLYSESRDFPVLHLPETKELGEYNRYVCKHYSGEPHGIVSYTTSNGDSQTFFPRIGGGGVESLLFTNPYGVCKCQKCRQVFPAWEQEQMARLIAYLNTPHYYTEEALSHHKEWLPALAFFDEGYPSENEPYSLLSTEKILELSKGIEPVLYKKTHKKSRAEIIKKLRWEDGKWRV